MPCKFLLFRTCRRSWWVCVGVFFFVWDGWLIGLRFVVGAWGRGLGANVRADVRVTVYLAGNGRFCLEFTAGGSAVHMGRAKDGQTKSSVQFMHGAKSCPSVRTQSLTATGAPSQTSAMPCHAMPCRPASHTMSACLVLVVAHTMIEFRQCFHHRTVLRCSADWQSMIKKRWRC